MVIMNTPGEIMILKQHVQQKRHVARHASPPQRQSASMDIDTIIGACQSIAIEIKKNGQEIDMILAVSRDAAIPARLLAMYLQGPHVFTYLPDTVDAARCLIIDDAAYTGKTLLAATRQCKERGMAFNTACVVLGEDSKFEPDFHAISCSSGSRIVFPWQKAFLDNT
jgi:hypoxanthine phosphoribosyltransferase